MYLGGNGLNCEVEFLDDAAIVVPQHEVEPHRAAARPARRPVESRFTPRHESEANLLGVVFTTAGIMTAAPYRVVDAVALGFEGTGLKKGDVFGKKSLHMRVPGGASGHETDKVSPHSPKNVRCWPRG